MKQHLYKERPPRLGLIAFSAMKVQDAPSPALVQEEPDHRSIPSPFDAYGPDGPKEEPKRKGTKADKKNEGWGSWLSRGGGLLGSTNPDEKPYVYEEEEEPDSPDIDTDDMSITSESSEFSDFKEPFPEGMSAKEKTEYWRIAKYSVAGLIVLYCANLFFQSMRGPEPEYYPELWDKEMKIIADNRILELMAEGETDERRLMYEAGRAVKNHERGTGAISTTAAMAEMGAPFFLKTFLPTFALAAPAAYLALKTSGLGGLLLNLVDKGLPGVMDDVDKAIPKGTLPEKEPVNDKLATHPKPWVKQTEERLLNKKKKGWFGGNEEEKEEEEEEESDD